MVKTLARFELLCDVPPFWCHWYATPFAARGVSRIHLRGSGRNSHSEEPLTPLMSPLCRSSGRQSWRHCSGRIRAPQQPQPPATAGRLSRTRPRQRRRQQLRQRRHQPAALRRRAPPERSGRRNFLLGVPPPRRPHSHSSRRRSGRWCSRRPRHSKATSAQCPRSQRSSRRCSGCLQMACRSRLSSRCSHSSRRSHSRSLDSTPRSRRRAGPQGMRLRRSRSRHRSSPQGDSRY